MSARRTEPKFGKTDSLPSYRKSDDDPMSCVLLPIAIVVSYFVVSAIVRVTSNSGSKLDQIICYGALICFVIIVLLGARNLYQDGKARAADKAKWAEGCTTALLTIASRHRAFTWWDDYYERGRSAPNCLRLEMNADQKEVSPHDTIVQVNVSQHVYDRLEDRDTVRIYYMPESPLTFLLEDEL
jgi:hypothetical protein